MTEAWQLAPTGAAAGIAAAVAAVVPVIETTRLRLRAPVIGDFPAYRAVFVSDRSRYIGGPFTDEEAFGDFCQGVAGWMLRGAGMWTLTEAGSDTAIGWIYLWTEMGDAEPELGWILVPEAEGQGYATEAARAVLPHALQLYGAGGFVSYIDAENDRSARLALSLGAVRDAAAETAVAAKGEVGLHVYRHSGKGVPA
ncbi:MAG: GNAT family N-acetyltransferase [Paracoccaceae bacterium]